MVMCRSHWLRHWLWGPLGARWHRLWPRVFFTHIVHLRCCRQQWWRCQLWRLRRLLGQLLRWHQLQRFRFFEVRHRFFRRRSRSLAAARCANGCPLREDQAETRPLRWRTRARFFSEHTVLLRCCRQWWRCQLWRLRRLLGRFLPWPQPHPKHTLSWRRLRRLHRLLGLQGCWPYPRPQPRPQYRRWCRQLCLWTRHHHRCPRLRRLLGLRRLLVLMGKPLGEVRREDPAKPAEGTLHLMPARQQIPLFNEDLHGFCHRLFEVVPLARD